MKTMGVDLSSRSLAMVGLSDQVVAFKYAVPVKEKGRQAIANRLYADGLSALQEFQPDTLYIEEPVVAGVRNLQSSLKIAQVCGVLMGAAASVGMERVYLVPVSTWKAGVVGHGSADKQRVRAWLDENKPEIAAVCGNDQDLRDAACVALYGQRLLSRVDAISSQLHDGQRLP